MRTSTFLTLALAPALAAIMSSCGPAAPPHTPSPTAGGARVLKYVVITVGRPSGSGEVRVDADGTRHTHFTFNDRGRGPDVTTEMKVDEHGAPRWFRATGH